jgi:hypothetical protein
MTIRCVRRNGNHADSTVGEGRRLTYDVERKSPVAGW